MPTEGNYTFFFCHLIQGWHICLDEVEDEKLEWEYKLMHVSLQQERLNTILRGVQRG